MLPSELTETLRPPDSVLRLGRFLEELLECPYVFQGSNPVSFTLTLTDAEGLAGQIGARYLSPILLGAAWAEYASEHRLQMKSVKDFVFWVGRLQQAAYQEIYDTNVYGQTKLKSQPLPERETARRTTPEAPVAGPRTGGPPSSGFLSPSLERAAAFGLGAAAATSAQQSFTGAASSASRLYQPVYPGQTFSPGQLYSGGFQGRSPSFVESGGALPQHHGFSLPPQAARPEGFQGSVNLPPQQGAPQLQTASIQASPGFTGPIPSSVMAPLSQMEPGGIQWLISQSSGFTAPSLGVAAGSIGQAAIPSSSRQEQARPELQNEGEPQGQPSQSPGLFLPALIGAAVWLASRRGGGQSGTHHRGEGQGSGWTGYPPNEGQEGGSGQEWQGQAGQEASDDQWTGRGGVPAWQRGREPAPATARMGFATLFSAAPTFATQAEGESGSAVQLPLESLVPAGQPLTESGMTALVAALPPGASFLYPSLPPGSLGRGAINVPLAAGLADRLIQASAPGQHTGATSRMAARLAKAESPGSSGSAPLAATLIPTHRPTGAMGGGAAAGEGMGALGSGMSQRPRSLSFLGAPVRLAPSLSGRSELQDEVRAKSGSQMSSQPMPSKPTSFSDLRSQVLGGMPTVDVEPDQQAWSKARPSMGLASASPLEVLSGDAWNPTLTEVRTGRKDASSAGFPSAAPKMGDGSVRPGIQASHRPISTIGTAPISKGLSGLTPPAMKSAPSMAPSFGAPPEGAGRGFDPVLPGAGGPFEHRGEPEGERERPLGSIPSPTILKLDQGAPTQQAQFKGGPGEQHDRQQASKPDQSSQGFGLGSPPAYHRQSMPPSLGERREHSLPAQGSSGSPAFRQDRFSEDAGGREAGQDRTGFGPLMSQGEGQNRIHTPSMSLDLPRHAARQDEGTPRLPGLGSLMGEGESQRLKPQLPLPDVGMGRPPETQSRISAVGEMKEFKPSSAPASPSVPLPGPAPLPLPKRPSPKASIQAAAMSGQFAISVGEIESSPSAPQADRSAETRGSSTTGIDSHEVNAMAMEVYSILRRRLAFESQRMGR